ncbi:hypothetical protein [Streptomyces albipurpureus]|uniref:Ig-like domain-containing protein n=1 Tax=Streptomyces albipurpureus TaxID=2897419 RepID=A0ABT0V026_9ACTN|nr:hypothetical protein [Streptomyces sp. CWNU-1]MCM2393564.1 hypothetical protein [Streptomyces sp. CWNU-1]
MSATARITAGRRAGTFGIAALLLLTGASLTTAQPAKAAVPAKAAKPAKAAGIDVECLGSFSRTFSPAITLTPQSVTGTATYTYNTCAIGSTGSGSASSTLTISCIPLAAGPPETETVTWLDPTGGSSVITWSQPTVVAQTIVFTGTVTSGRYLGDAATKITSGVSYVGSVIGCLLGTPISGTTGLVDSLLLTS